MGNMKGPRWDVRHAPLLELLLEVLHAAHVALLGVVHLHRRAVLRRPLGQHLQSRSTPKITSHAGSDDVGQGLACTA